jgi:hypothetical protein
VSIKRSAKVVLDNHTTIFPAHLQQPRGFYRVTYCDRRYFVRQSYHLVPCDGEAHSNAHIDNCSYCLSHVWGLIAIPLAFGTLADFRDDAAMEGTL